MSKAIPVTLRFAALLAVFILALIGILFVLDVIPRDVIKEVTVKTLLVIGILTAAALIVASLVAPRENK